MTIDDIDDHRFSVRSILSLDLDISYTFMEFLVTLLFLNEKLCNTKFI